MLMKELAISEHVLRAIRSIGGTVFVFKSHLDIVGKWCEWLPRSQTSTFFVSTPVPISKEETEHNSDEH